MNVLVIAPYEVKYLKTIEALEKLKYGKISIIGDYNIIDDLVKKNRIKIKTNVINISLEEDILLYTREYAKEYIKDSTNNIILFGNISEVFIRKILNVEYRNEFNDYYVVDMPNLRHFVFLSNSTHRHFEMEEKKKSIVSLHKFMSTLGIRKANVCLITNNSSKSDTLEFNLMRMVLSDELRKNINILKPSRLNDIFSMSNEFNIYDSMINMLVFKNRDMTKTFVDTLSTLSNYRVGNICEMNNQLFVNGANIKDEENIMFSLLLINKSIKSKKHIVKYAV